MTDARIDFDPSLSRISPDEWTRPFWDAAREHRLVAARCGECGAFRMPPTALCWRCRSRAIEWVDLPGTGTVYTFTVARHPLTPEARHAVPYVIAVVALDSAEGARLITNVVGIAPEEVAIDMAVEVVFDDVTEDTTVPRFRPTGQRARPPE
jgi:uncharacterized OB-fold protein